MRYICRLIGHWCSFDSRMGPALSGNTALQRFERSNPVEMHNGIMFDFYPGLQPNVLFLSYYFVLLYVLAIEIEQ